MKNALVILASGKGRRFSQKTPKQFFKIGNTSMINTFFQKINFIYFDIIVISIENKYRKILDFNSIESLHNQKKIVFSKPGKTRQESSFNSLNLLKKYKIDNVLIHDAARPFCSNELIRKILYKLKTHDNCIPYVNYSDRKLNKSNKKDVEVINIQTPQGFNYKSIYDAHLKFKNKKFSDDAGLIQKMGKKINFLKGEKTNVKITYPEDIIYFKIFNKPIVKSGIGYDIHQINKNTKTGLKLCGIKIPYSKLVGHSDADVGLHAVCDSIFGALSMRDIGYYFPNTDKRWKNANSSLFVKYCKEKLLEKGFYIINLDINIIAEKPNISKYVYSMKKKIASLLKIDSNCISIKATTNEKIGFIGNGDGIAAEAIVQITNENIF